MPNLGKLFISHSHKDEPLAAAFRDALTGIFGSIVVAFSSDKKAGGGPQPGSNWLEWIHNQMLDCEEALLLLTPYSIQKPWPMWEAGAVQGIALAGRGTGREPGSARLQKPVTPIRFRVPPEALPGPFVVTQAFDGTNGDELTKLLALDPVHRGRHRGGLEAAGATLDGQDPALAGRRAADRG